VHNFTAETFIDWLRYNVRWQ